MTTRKASIKETGEELSQADWARFDAAAAKVKAEKPVPLRDDERATGFVATESKPKQTR